MATEQTSLANSIDVSADKAKLDEVAKKLVKHKIILAEILKECVEEFREKDWFGTTWFLMLVFQRPVRSSD